MYKIALTLSLFVLGNVSYSQAEDFIVQPANADSYSKGFKTVYEEPKFPGGIDGWTTFLALTLKSNVPVKYRAPEGLYTVVCSFLVLKDGTISEVTALNDPGYGAAEEAIRVLKKSPKWIPALQNGRPIAYRQTQSITFEVSEANYLYTRR